jgi:hypothetical protein
MAQHVLEMPVKGLADMTPQLVRTGRVVPPGTVVRLAFPDRRIPIYPNDAVSLASTIDALRSRGTQFESVGMNAYTRQTGLIQPLSVHNNDIKRNPVNRVVRYDDESDAHLISNLLMQSLTNEVVCEAGVIDALNWCIYEVLDNVFQHSQASSGYVMAQLHAKRRTFVIAVGDSGRGIHRSLAMATDQSKVDRSQLSTAHLAIAHALQQGVTSKGNLNQGNGLHGLRRSVEINGGSLTVASGRGIWSLNGGTVRASTDPARPVLDPETSHSTIVDWRLDCATAVSINDALGRPEQASQLLEEIEVGPNHYRIDATDIEPLVGSRQNGEKVRTRINNYLRAGASQIVIDLSNVGVISSSFADEVAGKLAEDLGESEFRRRIFFDRVSPTNRGLIDRAIELRLKDFVDSAASDEVLS